MAKKESNLVQISRIIKDLGPEEQKRLGEILEENMEKLKVDFPKIIEEALHTMIQENATPRLASIYDKVRTKNALDEEKRQAELKQDQDFERLLRESDEIIDSVMTKK